MSSARRQARQAAVGMLYAFDVGNERVSANTDLFLEESKLKGKHRDFAIELFQGAHGKLADLDTTIAGKLVEGWSFDRLGRVERAILRLAVYELLFTETDQPVVINEAIEIAKEMADDQAPRLINGVLESIRKSIKKVS